MKDSCVLTLTRRRGSSHPSPDAADNWGAVVPETLQGGVLLLKPAKAFVGLRSSHHSPALCCCCWTRLLLLQDDSVSKPLLGPQLLSSRLHTQRCPKGSAWFSDTPGQISALVGVCIVSDS